MKGQEDELRKAASQVIDAFDEGSISVSGDFAVINSDLRAAVERAEGSGISGELIECHVCGSATGYDS